MIAINSSDVEEIIQVILKAQRKIQWKPQKAHPHLKKRIRLGHLPEDATIATYEAIILQVLMNPKGKVYVYRDESLLYPTVTSTIDGQLWLVILGMDSILETAFPPNNPKTYLGNRAFIYLGILEDFKSNHE
ncbi:MAG: hypothetical protein GVY17_02705 [Cyanobacteria bacterium]|jgi:hypothetical protein|nr:hypothetical protein [Cyanobacteria bacterium GSL.Bin21]